MSLRTHVGALVYDWPRFLRHLPSAWVRICNRRERIEYDGRGARCEWLFTSTLHLADVYPVAGRWLMARALRDWPVILGDSSPAEQETPEVSFIIGHRGTDRVPHLLATLRSIAGQEGCRIECIVVEQAVSRQVEEHLPSWVRYSHQPIEAGMPYNRAATFNRGAILARGSILILHDNDMLVPARYAAESLARIRGGAVFADLKRFIFYLATEESRRLLGGADVRPTSASVVQNLRGGSIVAERTAYDAIGGFDEAFVGWGGEDNDFWDRAETTGRVYSFGYLPIIHIEHPPQGEKLDRGNAPAVLRYEELRAIDPRERIDALRSRQRPGG
jgi:hypothetical protein